MKLSKCAVRKERRRIGLGLCWFHSSFIDLIKRFDNSRFLRVNSRRLFNSLLGFCCESFSIPLESGCLSKLDIFNAFSCLRFHNAAPSSQMIESFIFNISHFSCFRSGGFQRLSDRSLITSLLTLLQSRGLNIILRFPRLISEPTHLIRFDISIELMPWLDGIKWLDQIVQGLNI